MSWIRQTGFSLLEVLVAFAILALALTTILALFATGLRNTAVAGDYVRATAVAEAQLARLQAAEFASVVPEQAEGVFDDRYHWRSESRLLDAESGVAGVGLYALHVEVRWREAARERQLALASVRLGRLP